MERAKQLFRTGDFGGAAEACRAALANGQDVPQALTLIGSIAVLTGSVSDAIPLLRLAKSLAPDDIGVVNALGLAYRKVGRWADARVCFETLLRRDGERPEVLRNLAHTLKEEGEWQKSAIIFAKLFTLKAEQPKDQLACSEVLSRLERHSEALSVMRRYLAAHPDADEGWFNLAQILQGKKRAVAALRMYQRSINVNPRRFAAYTNMSAIAHLHGNAAIGAKIARDCLAEEPRFLPILMNYGLALGSLGKTKEAIAAFEKVVANIPNSYRAHSNVVFFNYYRDDVSAKQLYELHRNWDARYARPLAPLTPSHANVRSPNKRLRIGYVSPDFCFHSCTQFLHSLYEHHDRYQVELFSYSSTARSDDMTKWVREHSDTWRDVLSLDQAQLAEMVAADGIDILVDLAGHTAGNNLLTFARKPAPVQVTWLGYPGTTGLGAIDYRLSDPWLTPEGTPEMMSEQIFNLPRVSHCFTPPTSAPDVGPLPGLQSKMITFGSFNHYTKMSDATIALWSGLLKKVENAQLLLKSRYIDNPEVREHLYGRFAAAGADTSRIVLTSGHAGRDDHLSTYNKLDVAVDTTPYGGMTTSCEALWMGVPVLTLAGERTCGRYGVSLMSAVGLEGFIAKTPEEFAEIGARLDQNRPYLAELRAGMRDRMIRSPLCDERGFAKAVEGAYREMWTRWCRSAS
ncbi:tetratricopeptide repeat protein [Azospirillum sp. sgz301742]